MVEDLAAKVYVKVWEKKETFDNFIALRKFMYKVLKNAATNEVIRLKRKSEHHEVIEHSLTDVEDYIESRIIKAELVESILNEAKKIPPQRRKIFEMFYLQNIPAKEIAARLGITENTVWVQNKRAIDFLKKAISI